MTDGHENNQLVAETWMESVWRQHDLDAIDELHAPDFTDRSPSGRGVDNAAYKAGIAALYQAFPDFCARTEDLVIDPTNGKVAIRWTASGTHSASFLGQPATGKVIQFAGIEILHIEGGRIVERWGEWDGIGLLAQLSAKG